MYKRNKKTTLNMIDKLRNLTTYIKSAESYLRTRDLGLNLISRKWQPLEVHDLSAHGTDENKTL